MEGNRLKTAMGERGKSLDIWICLNEEYAGTKIYNMSCSYVNAVLVLFLSLQALNRGYLLFFFALPKDPFLPVEFRSLEEMGLYLNFKAWDTCEKRSFFVQLNSYSIRQSNIDWLFQANFIPYQYCCTNKNENTKTGQIVPIFIGDCFCFSHFATTCTVNKAKVSFVNKPASVRYICQR